MAKISGVWRLTGSPSIPSSFNDTVNVKCFIPSLSLYVDCTNLSAVSETYQSYFSYKKMYTIYNGTRYRIGGQSNPDTGFSWERNYGIGRVFDFGEEEQDVSDALVNWVSANGVQHTEVIDGTFTLNTAFTPLRFQHPWTYAMDYFHFTSNGKKFDGLWFYSDEFRYCTANASEYSHTQIFKLPSDWISVEQVDQPEYLTFTTDGPQKVTPEVAAWLRAATTPLDNIHTSVDLSSVLQNQGTYSITAVAKADGYLDSEPSNAVEYVVADDTIVGTWLFNEYINVNGGAWYAVDFTSNGTTYIAMSDKRSEASSAHDMSLKYFKSASSYDTAFSGAEEFTNEAYRTITITAEPTDEEFIAWLKANATKQTITNDGPHSGGSND